MVMPMLERVTHQQQTAKEDGTPLYIQERYEGIFFFFITERGKG